MPILQEVCLLAIHPQLEESRQLLRRKQACECSSAAIGRKRRLRRFPSFGRIIERGVEKNSSENWDWFFSKASRKNAKIVCEKSRGVSDCGLWTKCWEKKYVGRELICIFSKLLSELWIDTKKSETLDQNCIFRRNENIRNRQELCGTYWRAQ